MEQLLASSRFLMQLTNLIRLRRPLPQLNNWTSTEELLETVILLLKKNKPNLVVEAGSGVSSLVIGYVLKANKRGKIYSLEHNKSFYEQTKKLIREHRLAHYCKVLYTPLRPYQIDNQGWLYYDLSCLSLKNIDLLFIDGPPGNTQSLARYPAMPLLIEKLNSHATVILDDYNRQDEQQIIKEWLAEFSEFKLKALAHPRGTAILTR